MYQQNNSVTFGGQPMGSDEILNRMIETLGIIIIDRRSKGRPRKRKIKP